MDTISAPDVSSAPNVGIPSMLAGWMTVQPYSVMVGEGPPGSPAPALHEHPTTDEAFYVASGECSFQLEDEQILVPAGGLVFVPRGTVHTAWNAGSEVLRGLIIISPGNVEHEFVEVEVS